ncbi:MAG: KilA-N domain-containing protein [Bacteroidota bacterium]
MAKQTIEVDGKEITINQVDDQNYISLTDMVANLEEGTKVIENWLRTRSTLGFLGAWEQVHNKDFNSLNFEGIMRYAGDMNFTMSVKKWSSQTGAIGIRAKTGRYGGTFAHSDIAFEFAMAISPMFKVLLIKEFQRLKEEEAIRINSGWDYSRFLSKVNYRIHTDAIRDHLIPRLKEQAQRFNEVAVYANEADLLNLAVFGMTAKEWREANPTLAKKGNLRDHADVMQLNVLANLESLNSVMIEAGASKEKRFQLLCKTAISQYERLAMQAGMKKLE